MGISPSLPFSAFRFLGYLLLLPTLLTGCGGGGSGGAGTNPPPPLSNPVPAIASITPNSATSGGSAFTLTITGQNFISSSTVYWNSPNALTTTYVSSTQLQAQVTAADIASAGSAMVSVGTPTPGGGNSGQVEFTINAISNPGPTLTSLAPAQVNAGGPGFVLTLNGTNFMPNSTIQWSGTALPTSYLSDTQLEAQIPATSNRCRWICGDQRQKPHSRRRIV